MRAIVGLVSGRRISKALSHQISPYLEQCISIIGKRVNGYYPKYLKIGIFMMATTFTCRTGGFDS